MVIPQPSAMVKTVLLRSQKLRRAPLIKESTSKLILGEGPRETMKLDERHIHC